MVDSKYNSEPWNRSIFDRCRNVFSSREKDKKIALYIYEYPDTSTFRYRAYNIMQATLLSNKWCVEYFFSDTEKKYIFSLLPYCDIVVLIRIKWTYFIDEVIVKIKALNKKVIFDADDLVFDLDYMPLLINTVGACNKKETEMNEIYKYWSSYIGRIGLTASKCDGFITTNKFLGNMYEKKFHKPFRIIRNTINDEQLAVSKKYCKYKNNSNKFIIGYFSGSPSHSQDFMVIAYELKNLLEKYEDIQLLVVGFMEFPHFLQSYINSNRVIFKPLVNFLELQKLIAGVDINIVPLVDNIFTNCKSELKFFEAAITRTVTIATPIYTYVDSIQHEINGFLCKSGEWFDTIEKIYKKEYNIEIILDNAYETAINKYYDKNIINDIESTLSFWDNM